MKGNIFLIVKFFIINVRKPFTFIRNVYKIATDITNKKGGNIDV